MAKIQNIHILLFLLALTTQFAEARQMKAVKEPKLSPGKVETGRQNHAKEGINVEPSAENHNDINLKVTGGKTNSVPMAPGHELSSSDATTPGNSPGIGHSFGGKKDNMQQNVKDFTSVAGKTVGLQSTTPGHSPGVGHSIGNLKAGPKT